MSPATARLGLPNLGDGVGLRDVHFRHLLATSPETWGVDWFEIVSENFLDDHGFAAHVLDHVAAHRPVVMHGVSLSIGSTDPLDTGYLRKLAALADRVRPAWISDHLCWTGVNGVVSHDLLPMPLTRRSLAHVAGRVRAVQDRLGRPLILENPSTYLEFGVSEIPEWEFLAALAEATGCGLLLDVNNVFVSAFNHGFDAVAYVENLPAEHIVQVHLAGPSDQGSHLLDTHDRPVPDEVWGLYALAQQRTGGVATLLEWDADIPPFADLVAELAKAADVRAAALPITGQADPPVAMPAPATVAASAHRPASRAETGPQLPDLQEWMLSACTAADADPDPSGPVLAVRDVVRASGRQSAGERLGVYARGYLARLLGCLRAEFPVLHALVGDQVFDLFGQAYIAACPPRSYTLFDLGAGFPGFLAETRPRPLGPPGSSDALPAALGRLERARLEARCAPGVETDPAHAPIDPVAVMTMPDLVVRTPGSLRLLRLDFALLDALAAADRGERPDLPAAADTRYAVARSRYRVRVRAVAPWQHAFLRSCGTRGRDIPAAIATTAEVSGLDPADLWADLVTWLPLAVDAGMATVEQSPTGQVRGSPPRR